MLHNYVINLLIRSLQDCWFFTFTFTICHHISVCPSVVCRLSVTFVLPTQAIEIFRNISMPFGTVAIHWHRTEILRRSSWGNPSIGGS